MNNEENYMYLNYNKNISKLFIFDSFENSNYFYNKIYRNKRLNLINVNYRCGFDEELIENLSNDKNVFLILDLIYKSYYPIGIDISLDILGIKIFDNKETMDQHLSNINFNNYDIKLLKIFKKDECIKFTSKKEIDEYNF